MSTCDLVRAAILAAAVTLAGCSGHAPAKKGTDEPFFAVGEARPAPAPVASTAAGRKLFRVMCRSCHDQRGGLGRDLDPVPPDLGTCRYKLRSTPTGSLPTDDDILRVLYIGIPGTSMPSFASLVSLPALRALVVEVKRRCDRFRGQKAGVPIVIPPSRGFDDASARRGEKTYTLQGCSSCHGAGGAGDGPAAGSLKDAAGRQVWPRNYTRGVYRSGFRPRDIYRAFTTGLDGTPMPALPASVSTRDRWDLTHFIVSLGRGRSRLWKAVSEMPTWYDPAFTW